MEWQSIETAPKDGTWIMLGYYPEYMENKQQGGHPQIAWWSSSKDLWSDSVTLYRSTGLFSPTHWMPLPDPPKP